MTIRECIDNLVENKKILKINTLGSLIYIHFPCDIFGCKYKQTYCMDGNTGEILQFFHLPITKLDKKQNRVEMNNIIKKIDKIIN